VLQNSPLLAGDIFSNIVGVKGGSLDDAWAAARMVGLEQDIKEMAMGMHTAIGEGSSTLSGGQRQRILIARALAGNPKILFLDEATSALDNKSQTVVAESLLRLKATRVVIAHRLSTIVEADQIIVLEAGKLVQQGRYDELLEQEGAFAELAKRQNVDISARRQSRKAWQARIMRRMREKFLCVSNILCTRIKKDPLTFSNWGRRFINDGDGGSS
jgi:ABC-type bacteriocin/lantibiotic exporter with double-glycine peptidase domain